MKIAYVAQLTEDSGSFLVEFPDLPGCLTEGHTRDEAMVAAQEALTGYLASALSRGLDIPEPINESGDRVEPDAPVALACWLRFARRRAGLTQAGVADKLGVPYQVYQKYERGSGNPTLRKLKALERVFGQELVLV